MTKIKRARSRFWSNGTPARLRPTPTTISSTKSVRACGNATPFSTTLGWAGSRDSTCSRRALVLGTFPVCPSNCTIARIPFAALRERSLRTTCCSWRRSVSAIGIGGGEIYWIIRQTQLSSNCRPTVPLGAPRIVATPDTAIASKEERTVSLQRSIYDPGYVNAMSHFYRGELGRIMVWRQRLDMTTNWAITSSTAIITIAFSTREVPHIIFFFNLAIVAVLLWIESRRYRFYDAFRARIRMLEAHFLVPMVMENRELLQGEWKKLVCEDLILPSFKIT